jgi:hypothetical protein
MQKSGTPGLADVHVGGTRRDYVWVRLWRWPAWRRSSAMPAGTEITIPGRGKVRLPKDWEAMSIEELAELGIVPHMQYGDEPKEYEDDGGGGAFEP